MNQVKPVIVVHGGAKTISEDKLAANHAGYRAAAEVGWTILRSGGSAAAAVAAAIQIVESDQILNAGFGSTMNAEAVHPDQSAQRVINTLKARVKGEAGCILLDRQGRVGWAYNPKNTAVAYMTNALQQPAIFTEKESSFAIA